MNVSLFNFIFGFSRRNFLIDDTGIFFAQYVPYFLILGFIWILFGQTGWRRRLFFLSESLIAVILSRGLITEIIRFFYYSPRPFEALHFTSLIPESGSSFPSGHAAFYFALATALFFYNRRAGIWYFILSLLIGVARIFVGVHWPLDVLAGAVLGVLCGLFVHWLLSRYYSQNSIPPLGNKTEQAFPA
ncbi:MAG: phosphatase PAP2 family protein [Candidatus Liptonbacteria bacterium]|nr:phosphatase PAP2 family protein [Parcubacteria group bacterium]MBI4086038.1 phosphatase PAP2 family protein [Candidatus Liptonbacteria bacterium]